MTALPGAGTGADEPPPPLELGTESGVTPPLPPEDDGEEAPVDELFAPTTRALTG